MSLQENQQSEENQNQQHGAGDGDEAAIELIDTPEKRRLVAEAADEIIQLEKDRKAINDEMNEIRAKVEAQGINKKAFKRAVQRKKLTESDRLVDDVSYAFCCTAMDIEHQTDMFKTGPTTH